MQSSALVSLFMISTVILASVAQPPDVEVTEESYWGVWESWTCSKPCGLGKVVRLRPCIGLPAASCMPLNASQQFSPDDCRLAICPKDCGERKWGLDCVNTCSNCLEDCDKNTGDCNSCLPGYFNPTDGGPLNCTTECPQNTYGFECRGSCINKCSKDCLDKKLGTCDVIAAGALYEYHQYFLILLIIPALTILSELIRKTQWSRGQGEEHFEHWNIPFYRKSRDAYLQQTVYDPDADFNDDPYMNVDLHDDPVDEPVDEIDNDINWKGSSTNREWDTDRLPYGTRSRYNQ